MMKMNNEGKGVLKTAILVIVGLAILGALFGNTSSSDNDSSSQSQEQSQTTAKTNTVSESTPAPTEEPIEYTSVTVKEMYDLLDENALKAETVYDNAYLEITGKLKTIDSDGKYISIYPVEEEFSFDGVQCYIKSEEQKNQVLDMKKDDVLTIRVKIKSIGEVLGYSADIIEFVQ